MRYIRGLYVLLAGTVSVLTFVTVILSGFTDHLQITDYQRWFSSALLDELATATESAKGVMWNGTKSNEPSKHGLDTVSNPTLHIKTLLVNNITLYVTAYRFRRGRLGNQMFRYASILGIARQQGRQVFVEPDSDLGDTFKLRHVAVKDDVNKWPVIVEDNPLSFDAKLMNLSLQHLRIDGYLQSYLYFAGIMDEVRQEFTFQDSVANAAAIILQDVYIKYTSSVIVGVHVRRSDFLTTKHQIMGYGVPDTSYFIKAFNLMKSKFPGRNMTFVVASDDLPWCSKNLLSTDVTVMSPASAAVHMAVLSNCDHMIISGGTYGWWSGWMADGYVIYYTGHLANGTSLGNLLNHYQYYPPMWIGLGN